ncbi:MAG TPA: malto-oligosyltrehalose trehalohydrolase [Thermoanaerobaculia bacterium]|nr:malto-oligosyltrehalose trehalohydrolase [Thermoanaerobaculia bacterium]
MANQKTTRKRAVGAEIIDGGVDFRLWAPDRKNVSVVINGRAIPLDREADGHFRGTVADARAGTRYRFRLDDDDKLYPDPASRFQPNGPHGDSEVVDPAAYRWNDGAWAGVDKRNLVIYEMHIGTFTAEGTWRTAIAHLGALRDIGINLLEVMPVHEFPGRFGWGYDGVDLWAPSHLYGRPDDFRVFVDAAHAHGLGVILDVVYNHFGPDGCYLRQFTKNYFTNKYVNDWGESINFDGDGSAGVRELVSENAAMWIGEFHLDGLRLDATQSINDASDEHVLALIARRARAAATDRSIFLVAENEPQDVALIDDYGLDALWNDDWHHAAMVAATGRREAYYTDYFGTPQEFVSMAQFGFLYQGQYYSWQKEPRGTSSLHLSPRQLVCFTQNHDQIANSGRGERLQQLTSPGRFRALTALLLLGPNTPMLFQGQEFGAATPFLYFADHNPELAKAVGKGRREFLEQFPSLLKMKGQFAPPEAEETFRRCKLDDRERVANVEMIALHRDLIRLRREMSGTVRGAVLAEEAFVLRFDNRLLIVNLGREVHLDVVPEPLLAPPTKQKWELLWSSESPDYGGTGTPAIEIGGRWCLSAQAAVLLAAT